jgi:mono/diheme cytochrome c family protein
MAPWEHALEQAELEALVNLIQNWDRIPSGAIPAPDRPIPVTAESLALGEQLYASTCIGCHGAEGEGTQRAPSLNVKGFLTETSDAAIEQIVTLGVPGTSMPAWGDRISEAEIQAVVGFIRSWEPTAPEVAQPSRVRGPWWQSAGSPPSSGTSSGQNLPSGGTGSGHTSGESVPAGGAGQGSGGGQTPGDPAASETAGNHTGTPPWSASTAAPAWWDNLDPRILALGGGLSATSLVLIGAAFLKLRKLG